MVDGESILRGAAIACFLAGLAGSFSVVAKTQEPKPGTAAEKPEAGKSKTAPQPPRRDRDAPTRDSAGEERPRPDVPVSFPVDI